MTQNALITTLMHIYELLDEARRNPAKASQMMALSMDAIASTLNELRRLQ